MVVAPSLAQRARVHAALGDPIRLRIVDALRFSDRSPKELERLLAVPSNLLTHHLDSLEAVGLVERHRSSGDGRRRYVHLVLERLQSALPIGDRAPAPALFVCTGNSARSQLAAALWSDLTGTSAASGGTHPADEVHPGAVAAARRAGLDLGAARPAPLPEPARRPDLVITVCDRAHEHLGASGGWLHWSVPDPVPVGTRAAFDAVVVELRARIVDLAGVA